MPQSGHGFHQWGVKLKDYFIFGIYSTPIYALQHETWFIPTVTIVYFTHVQFAIHQALFAELLPTTSVFLLWLCAADYAYLSGILITHLYWNVSYCISDHLYNLTRTLWFLILYSEVFTPFCVVWKFKNVFWYMSGKWKHSSVSDARQVCLDYVLTRFMASHEQLVEWFSNFCFYFTAVSTTSLIFSFLKKNVVRCSPYSQASYINYKRQPDGVEILKLEINIHSVILQSFSVWYLLALRILLAGFSSAYTQDTRSNFIAFMFGM